MAINRVLFLPEALNVAVVDCSVELSLPNEFLLQGEEGVLYSSAGLTLFSFVEAVWLI